MPDMFVFDDFDKCMAESDHLSSSYCVVNSYLKPDQSSKLYNYIHEFSKKEKQHFRHDKLQRGICVKDCLNFVKHLGNESEQFFSESFPMDTKLTFDFIKYPFVNEDRSRLNRILNVCVNELLVANYNLTGHSSIEYCLRKDASVPIGSETLLFAI